LEKDIQAFAVARYRQAFKAMVIVAACGGFGWDNVISFAVVDIMRRGVRRE
jgi:hypothetical protein